MNYFVQSIGGNDMAKIYTCYSPNLMKFLTKQCNIEYELVALNPTNHKKFWAFIRTKELNIALDKWSQNV